MSARQPEELIDRHEAFLKCAPADRPLVGTWRGGYYPAEQFPRGTSRWKPDRVITPDDVRFEAFAADYEQLYRLHREADDDFFYIGSAYWGIPWMEAILGCPVIAAQLNCCAEPCMGGASPAQMQAAGPDGEAWLRCLLDFTRELVDFAGDRFPVCPPLLRGPGDCASAMLGGTSFVMEMLDAPDAMAALIERCAAARIEVIRQLHAMIPAWHGTHAAGGYPSRLWSKRTVAYHQDDSAALLSPDLLRRFLLPVHRQMCQVAEINFVHLHSRCLYPVELLLHDRIYDAIQINIDYGGPSLAELIPTFQRIQRAGIPLIIWGELDASGERRLRKDLAPGGLSIQPIMKSP